MTFYGSLIKAKAEKAVRIIPKLKLIDKWFLFLTSLTMI